jgi:DNA-binding transcriptional MerR regulator
MMTSGQVAALTGLTIRALHHYDEIGLVRPSGRSEGGYRLYSADDLERLQEVLGWRALGFTLKAIGALLDDPAHDRGAALREQRELVAAERGRLDALAAALEAAIAAHDHGEEQEMSSMFDGFQEAAHAEEAERRWGGTEEYSESVRRTRGYDADTWRTIRAEADAITQRFGRLMRAGADPGGADAVALAGEHRDHISRWFYDCSPAVHRGLGELYAADPRFAKTWEAVGPGLTEYVRLAFAAEADSG